MGICIIEMEVDMATRTERYFAEQAYRLFKMRAKTECSFQGGNVTTKVMFDDHTGPFVVVHTLTETHLTTTVIDVPKSW